ncbi:hypothetical protein LP52_08950 [Streptomonospora alba]|uniref:Uncharacterized protein n=1 Tax=Streptomonospora alba TaxID=183763 RepID=A0A0C2G7E6_9ACTN|nr:hypothetical protein [Streptomonospora alba]KIH99233.1 hypothetical protein LP52_08950 [Streptomonospora alba]
MDRDLTLETILAGLALYAPVGEPRRGRISSTTLDPEGPGLLKAVVDFGSTPEGPDTGPDVEIASRRFSGAGDGGRELRAFCAERELMERRARDPASAQSFALGPDAAWSSGTVVLQGCARELTVLASTHAWVGGALDSGGVMVRVFTPAPGPGPAELRRIAAPEELEPLRGRG